MIIGIDARSLLTTPRTGVGEFTYELLSHLFQEESTHTYILFSNAWKLPQKLPFQSYKQVTWVTSRIPNKLLHASIRLFRYPYLDTYVGKRANGKKIDVWISPNLHFTSLSKKVKHILTIHDVSYHHYPSFFSKKGRMWHTLVHPKAQAKRANLILTPSENTARDIIDVYSVEKSKIHTLYPGVCSHITSENRRSLVDVKERYHLPDQFLLYLGTLEPRKNIDGILDAYQHSSYLKKKMPIIFAGSLGYKGKKYTQMIAQTDGARYIGYVDELDKHALYTLAHAFVYPSFYEGFGLPVLEAMHCGTPVITSHRTSLPEVVAEAGMLVNPYKIASLKQAMEDIIHDASLHVTYTEKVQKQAREFSWQKAATCCLEYIETL